MATPLSPLDPTAPVLVLGARGRIGQALLRGAPDAMRPRLRPQARRLAPAQAGGAAPAQGWRIFAPLEDPAALRDAARGCGQILCLAGAVPGRHSDLEDNTHLALAAVEAAAEAGCARVLLTSSAAVYGAGAGLLHEDQALTPANPYGQAKARMEAAAQTRGQALGVQVTSLRIGNVAGFDAILGGWRPGFTLDQFADGSTPRRSYIGVASLARTLSALLSVPDLPAALNLAQPGPMAMGDLLRAADLPFATRPAPEAAISEVAFDLARLQGCLPAPLPASHAKTLVAEWRNFCHEGQTPPQERAPDGKKD